MFKVGVTGGIGSGKTTVTDIFQQLGVEVVDADLVAREVVQAGTPALAQIAGRYGDSILLHDGNLNRAKLRERVFDDPREKEWLEDLLHPRIIQICRERLEHAHSPYAVLSSPLLIESGQHQLVDRVLVVDLPEDLQLTRTVSRDQVPHEQIQQIIASQINRAERLDHADDILDNSQDELQLRLATERLHLRYLQLAKQKSL